MLFDNSPSDTDAKTCSYRDAISISEIIDDERHVRQR